MSNAQCFFTLASGADGENAVETNHQVYEQYFHSANALLTARASPTGDTHVGQGGTVLTFFGLYVALHQAATTILFF
ncbi:hypothetical protein [Sneathiella litorea]|uniref:Uncharacterized protein n=1 Tax=Sneathiella litorea TaxID=2606216 RepID=A0A6L8WAT1_9PROT|nr:hypothetical protein [Sneathiella litorea]MZR31774.1 hypothetical protein [Sneathiella litorea]